MANKIGNTNGNWSTAGTWNSVTNTPTIHGSTNVTITGSIYTNTFTAPAITNFANGVLIYVTAIGNSDGTLTLTLQENTVDKNAVSINTSTLKINSWVYFPITPYQFTAVTAGYYRWKLTTTDTGTVTVAQSTTAGTPAYLSADDRTGVPGTTDNTWIVATVTVDGAQTIGAGTYTSIISSRNIGNAVAIGQSGLLTWDTTQSSTLTCKGNFLVYNGGELRMGTVAVPYNSSYVATLTFNPTNTTDFGLGSNDGGKITLQGTPKSSTTLWKTTYSSGVGTAADPLIVADSVDWIVNDEIVVGATNGSNQTEYKFIKTKNSATSYVLSDTVGGAESALSNTHTTNARIYNVERNVLINTNNTAKGFYYVNTSLTEGNINIDWARFETIGSSTANKESIGLVVVAGSLSDCDYSVAYRPLYRGFSWAASKASNSYTGLIACRQNSAAATGAFSFWSGSPSNISLTDCVSIGNNKSGFEIVSNIKLAFTRCYAIDCNTAADATAAGWDLQNPLFCTWTDCECHLSGTHGLNMRGLVAISNIFYNFLCGTKGTNTIDLNIVTDNLIDYLFKNSNFGSATLINNYLNSGNGSLVRFHNFNDVAMNHIWYTNFGSAQCTGTGLGDTTVRTASSYALRLSPENSADGISWETKILAKASSAVQVLGFLKKNAAFGTDPLTVELYLPGSTSPDVTQTMADDTNWNVFSLYANYVGTVDEYATVKFTAKSMAAGAYAYLDDIFNGSNKIIALDTWDNGQPSPIMFEQLGDAAAVWAVATATLTTPGTTGKKLVDGLTTGKFLALK